MDLQTLRALLLAEGFRPDAYDLGNAGHPSETYALRERDGAWVTFYAERGLETALMKFSTLEEAADQLLRDLRADPTTRYAARLPELQGVLADARAWLAVQPQPPDGSATWYGLNNLRSFLAQIESDPSRPGLERACHALGWHISDQYGAYDELPVIAAYNDRVRRIARGMARGA